MQRLLAAALLAGCYAPQPPAGAPCPDGACPSGLVCSPITQTCERTPGERDADIAHLDARPDTSNILIDAAIDTPPPPPFAYRRQITIVNQSISALATGYTIRVPLGTLLGQLVSQGKVKADYSDLRIALDQVTGERNRIIDTAPAPVAVNFSLGQSIAAGTMNQTYYLYYGAPGALGAPANGAAVFALYDDFNGALSSMWLKNDAPSTTGGRLLLRAAHTDAITTAAGSDNVPIISAVELVATVPTPGSGPTTQPEGTFYYWFGYQHTGDFSASDPWVCWISRSANTVHAEQKSPTGCELGCEAGPNIAQNTSPHYYEIDRDPTQTRFLFDGTLSYAPAVQNTADYSLMVRNYQATGDLYVDWIRARMRVTPDPIVTLGPEQAL